MKTKLILNEDELNELSKDKLLTHIMAQVEQIDKLRGYSSGVSKFQLLNYDKEVLVKISLTNNQYLEELC